MESRNLPPPDIADTAVRFLLGFFGGVIAFLFVPRTVKYLAGRFIWGFLGRFIAMVTFGFVIDRFADWLHESGRLSDHV
jgi:hypothetical protein